jgi:hypothetical protein
MSTAGEQRAPYPNDSYESDYTAPEGQVVTIEIKEGRPSYEKVILRSSQRVSFRNQDADDYRLRLRHGINGSLVGACVFLSAGKTAEFITEPDACDEHPDAGHFAVIEIFTPGQRVFTVYSGTIPHQPGGGPKFELLVISLVKPENLVEHAV